MGRRAEDLRIILHRAVRRQHVVIGGDDADIRRTFHKSGLLRFRRRGEGVRNIPAHQMRAPASGAPRRLQPFQIGRSLVAGAIGDAACDLFDHGMEAWRGHHGAQ
jgi:hypothetical protein